VAAPTQPAPTQTQPQAQITTGRKSPGLAFLWSLLIVGAGQGYNGQWGKGGLMFVGAVASWSVASSGVADCWDWDECGTFNAGIAGVVGFALWSWIDAPMTASSINRRLDAGIALEVGPQPRLGFPSDALVRSISPRRSSPQLGISLARLRF
jgi:hypothetical protein